MIATHSLKFLDARARNKALLARPIGKVPESCICSSTTQLKKEFWASPSNASEIPKWSDAAKKFSKFDENHINIPDTIDSQNKQLLIPTSQDEYISITPVTSMGLVNELYQRIAEQTLPYMNWTIQPTPAAMANHGETLLRQGGKVRLLRRGPSNIEPQKWNGSFIELTARCEKMNIASGFLSVGFPAITSIGGFIHSLERKTGCNIEFAIGIRKSEWSRSVPKVTIHKGSSGGGTTGKVQGKKVDIRPGYTTNEITATCDVVILLRGEYLAAIESSLKNVHNLAGGRLFDIHIKRKTNEKPEQASYLIDASLDIEKYKEKTQLDNLQAALDIYGMDGDWCDEEWRQYRNGYTLNHTGYALLEKPKAREAARGNYKHAWAEPTFSLITQGYMSDDCWWSRQSSRDHTWIGWIGSRRQQR